MKRIIIISICMLGGCWSILAQLRIDDCQLKARENFPLIRKYRLIEQAKEYSLLNASKAYLPQFQMNARATYQSEVTSIPITLPPGMEIPILKKDQYQLTLEASQLLWDGGAVRSQEKMTEAGSEVETRQVAVDVYALEDKVNQLFFGILSFDAQLEQNRILQDELQRNYTTIASYMANGIANQADLDAVKVEQLNARQIRTQIQSARKAFVEMLAIMTGEKLAEDVQLEKPNLDDAYRKTFLSTGINRPELQLFEAQNQWFDSQKALIKSSLMPRIALFLQGGIGRPGLNMLSNEFRPFYIGGVRLSWNFGALYTQKNDLQKIEINKNMTNVQRDLFLYQLNLTTTRENRNIQGLRELMKDDDEIIALRENIRKSAEAKVANGTLTVTDLVQEISRENLARQARATREIDLLIALYNMKYAMNR